MEALLQVSFLLWTYLVAAIPFGLVVTTLWGEDRDLRELGSGNIGATNVARTHGWRLALPVLLLDAAKGAGPVALAQAWWPQAAPSWTAAVALTAFAGHCFPVYLEFRGGKGVATAAGALLALCPVPTLLAAAVWAATLAWTGRSSVSALVAATAMVGLSAAFAPERVGVVLLLAVGIAATHTANIRRLLRGEESQVVRPVQWSRTTPITAADALSQGPAGQAVAPPPWPGSEGDRQDAANSG